MGYMCLGMEIRRCIVIVLDILENLGFLREYSALLLKPTPEHARNLGRVEVVHAEQSIFDILNEGLKGWNDELV